MAYLLDANVFIQASRLHYGFDICPGFWTWLEAQQAAGSVSSVAQVGRELGAGTDRLAEWARAHPGFFLDTDAATLTSMGTLAQWVTQEGYEPAARNTFLQVADYYLVAMAHAHGHVVVSHEIPNPSKRKVKIPNACVGLGVRFMNTFEMLRSEHVRFVLG